MNCVMCGKEITVEEPAAVVDAEGSRYYCFEEPLDESCYIKFMKESDNDMILEVIHSLWPYEGDD